MSQNTIHKTKPTSWFFNFAMTQLADFHKFINLSVILIVMINYNLLLHQKIKKYFIFMQQLNKVKR